MIDNLIYAVGDIHGCYDQLVELVNMIDSDAQGREYKIIFLGDYIDRGPKSKQVIDYLMELDKGKHIFLKGNHEDMLVNAIVTESSIYLVDLHLNNGGKETAQSYGIDVSQYDCNEIRPTQTKQFLIDYKKALGFHLEWIKSLKLYYVENNYVFVHAGIHPLRSMEEQDEQTLLWTRKLKEIDFYGYKYKVVHGHTAILKPEVTNTRINIDTGCCWTKKLTAAIIKNGKLEGFLQTNAFN